MVAGISMHIARSFRLNQHKPLYQSSVQSLQSYKNTLTNHLPQKLPSDWLLTRHMSLNDRFWLAGGSRGVCVRFSCSDSSSSHNIWSGGDMFCYHVSSCWIIWISLGPSIGVTIWLIFDNFFTQKPPIIIMWMFYCFFVIWVVYGFFTY